jgi:hypothetical protein
VGTTDVDEIFRRKWRRKDDGLLEPTNMGIAHIDKIAFYSNAALA